MARVPTEAELRDMSDDELDALRYELSMKLVRNFAIFIGFKAVLLYGTYRWTKAIRKGTK